MLISSRHKFIFFHVPKAAGSSITEALQKYSDYPFARLYHYMYDIFGQKPGINLYYRHIKPRELRTLMNAEKFDSYFKFAFVRNPWDWHVSQFHYHKQSKNAYFHRQLRSMNFEEYVEWAVSHIEEANADQSDFLTDAHGKILVDFIGKFENIENDFNEVRKKIGIQLNMKHKNPSSRKEKFQDYYSEKTKQLIAEAFAEDISRFNYAFEE